MNLKFELARHVYLFSTVYGLLEGHLYFLVLEYKKHILTFYQYEKKRVCVRVLDCTRAPGAQKYRKTQDKKEFVRVLICP